MSPTLKKIYNMTIQELKDSLNIVDVIGQYIDLKRHGINYIGHCPFHEENTPSFYVSQTKRIFKCFGCGVGGDVVEFVCRYENIGVKNALEKLSDNCHQLSPIVTRTPPQKNEVKDVCTIANFYVEKSADLGSVLREFLIQTFGEMETNKVLKMYHVGQTKDKGTIYFQIDELGRCRSGKIMHYDANGHRRKDDNTTWVHSVLKQQRVISEDWELTQCLFGQHLLKGNSKPIMIVEGEKTALIGAICFPQCLWLSVGGLGGFNVRMLKPLRGMAVTAFPDVHPNRTFAIQWQGIADKLNNEGFNITINERFQEIADQKQLHDKLDIGDVMVQSRQAKPTASVLLLRAKNRNPHFKAICEQLNLEII